MIPLEFALFCGPKTLAAITGLSRTSAAHTLAWWRRRAGWEPGPSISPTVLAAPLLIRGVRLESWSVDPLGGRTENAEEFAKRIWRVVQSEGESWSELLDTVNAARQELEASLPKEPAVRAEVKAALARVKKIRAERAARRVQRPLTVGEWLRLRSTGTWVLFVAAHVMAARNGELITGDTEYDDAPLDQAWRVLPPGGAPCQ